LQSPNQTISMKINTTLSVALFLISSTAFCQNWQLVWQDEFTNGISPDWVFETGTGAGGWGNNELQYYRRENATVSNGQLVITARRESFGGMQYTSARMKTQGRKSWKYGKIEARIAMPAFQGVWPAFWMLGDNITSVGWPACGEIDVMEHVNTGNTTHGTIHWQDTNGGYAYYGGNTTSNNISAFHTYAVEWNSSAIKWFVDGVQFHEANIANGINGTNELHNNHFILLNLAIGGNWPGFVVDNNAFPANMYVEYVRVYQAGGGGGTCPITPYVSVNGGGWQQTTSIAVSAGANITIGPQPLNGTWSWTGPNGFSSTSRSITRNNIQTNQAGTYRATYSYNGCTSTLDFNITVNGGGGGTFSKTIEAESYSASSGVIKENCSEGGQNVGSFDTGDWVAYDNVTIPTTGTYKVSYRVASIHSGRSLRLEKDAGATNLGTVSIPNTGNWQSWTTISHTVTLPAGTYTLGIATSTGGFNINRFNITNNLSARSIVEITPEVDIDESFSATSSPNPFEGSTKITVNLPQSGHTKVNVLDVNGSEIGKLHNGYLDAGVHEFDFKGGHLPTGLYVCTVTQRGKTKVARILKNK
jgi:beta-glucanase (GH16 family)